MHKLAVIIPAAGSGSRMGSSKPKPFLGLAERPILWHTLQAFLKVEFVSQVIIPVSKEWEHEVNLIFENIDSDKVIFQTSKGGTERQFSIQNALKLVSAEIELVAIHDAVRPFISETLIKKACNIASEFGGAIIGVPAKDTIKQVDKHLKIKSTPDRKFLWQAQTPQVFQKGLLMKAYSVAASENFIGTDDASLVERIGGDVKIVEGDRENLKITYPVDLQIAKLIINK